MANFKVRAIEMGVYGDIRRFPDSDPRGKGGRDVFTIKRLADFSFRWMEAIGWDPDPVAIKADADKRLAEMKASEAAKAKARKLAQKFYEAGDKKEIARVSGRPLRTLETIEEIEAASQKEIRDAERSVQDPVEAGGKRGPKRASDKDVGE
jgi:hypothetical protein